MAAHPEPDDVLQLHHKKNGHPRLPDPAVLDLLCRNEIRPSSSKSGSGAGKVQSKESREGPKSTQLGWYPPCWKSFLEDTKGECRTQHAIENPFPNLVNDISCSVVEVLTSSVVEWLEAGKPIEGGRSFFHCESRSFANSFTRYMG